MGSPAFQRDIRDRDPGQSGHRRARFNEGWRKAVQGETFTEATLKELTWENLGYRLGVIFGETSDEQIEEMYAWCAEQQSSKK